MPPRRRQKQPPDPEPARPNSPPVDREQSPEDEQEDEDDDDVIGHAPLPFYNTTFSAHRVSPLYLGNEPLTPNRLHLLSQRLRDRLVGDVVRGIEVGDAGEESIIGRAGALERVEITWVSVADVLNISRGDLENLTEEEEEDTTSWRHLAEQLPDKKALHLALRYELASCTALMLPSLVDTGKEGRPTSAQTRFSVGAANADDMDWEPSPDRFLSLPLLLLRMPAPLKTVIADFLSTTFDCRVSPMRLGTRSLVQSWEAWISSAGLPSRGPLAKDAVLSLGFHVPPPPEKSGAAQDEEETATDQQPLGLKAIDVIIPAAELQRFVAAGKRLTQTNNQQTTSAKMKWGWEDDVRKRRRLAGRLHEEGWEWRATPRQDGKGQPFTEALGRYLKEHLGLDLFHPGVRVVKIACGGFAMSENRLKVFAPAGEGDEAMLGQKGAVLELVGGLVEKAQVRMVAV
jgi:hypothetical protein